MNTSLKIQRYVWTVTQLLDKGQATIADLNNAWKESSIKEFSGQTFDRRTWYACFREITIAFGIFIEVDNTKGDGVWYIENPEDLENKNIEKWMLNCLKEQQILNECLELHNRIDVGSFATDNKILTDIFTAMKREHKLTVTYRKYDSETSKTYTIDPFFIKSYKDRLYLLCQMRRNFFLHWHSTGFCYSKKRTSILTSPAA